MAATHPQHGGTHSKVKVDEHAGHTDGDRSVFMSRLRGDRGTKKEQSKAQQMWSDPWETLGATL